MRVKRKSVVALMVVGLTIASHAVARDSALAEAVKRKDTVAVRALLATRADVNAPLGDGATPLHWAAYWDDLETVDLLIAAGARVNVANDLLITPLALASAAGNPALVQRLLDAGADPNRASETGVTPLMEAARTGNVAAAQALLTHRANVNAVEATKSQTALMWAVSQRHPDIVRVLIENGANVHARTLVRSARVMVDMGEGRGRGVKTSKELARQIETGGNTALLFAAQVGDTTSAAILLAAGANLNDASADGNSVLGTAALTGHTAFAIAMLEKGANPNVAGAGYTALHAAVLHGDLALVNALVAKRADVNTRLSAGTPLRRIGPQLAFPITQIGATPMFLAATYLEIEILRALAAAGADTSLSSEIGISPLLAAVGVGDRQHRVLRPKDFREDEEFSDLVRTEGPVLEAVKLVLERGADVRVTDAGGDTAMHGAASVGFTAVIQLLADRGADLNAKNKRGQTALALAIAGQKREGRPVPVQQLTLPPAATGLKQAEELLRKLGATP